MKTILIALVCILLGMIVAIARSQDLNELQMRERYRQSGSDNDRRALEMMQYQREQRERGQPQIVIPILPVAPRPPVLPIPQPKPITKPQ